MILRFSLVLLSFATVRADQRGLVGHSRVLHNINKHQQQLEASAECEWSGEKHCTAKTFNFVACATITVTTIITHRTVSTQTTI